MIAPTHAIARGCALTLLFVLSGRVAAQDSTAPSAPGPATSPNCTTQLSDGCIVPNATFTVSVTPATDTGGSGLNPTGYQFCRSNDVVSWGGCEVLLTAGTGTSFSVSGTDRPAPGKRRAFYVRARDYAGNMGPWSTPIYIHTYNGDASAPGAPGTPATSCVAYTADGCIVDAGSFTLSVTPAVDQGGSGLNANGYEYCRSNDTSGWAGCQVSMTTSSGTSFVVNEPHLPSAGTRRAYYVRARDNAGSWGAWSNPLYVSIGTGDIDPPSAPGAISTPSCMSMTDACVHADTTFVLTVAPATDSGSGVNTSGYQVCRSGDVTTTGGCDFVITNDANTSFSISGSHRPLPGKRRAYFFRARDMAGNWGAWTAPYLVQTVLDTTPPSVVASASATSGWRPINLTLSATYDPVALTWTAASDDVGVVAYEVLVYRDTPTNVVQKVALSGSARAYTIATSYLSENIAYTAAVRAVDAATNYGNWKPVGVFKVDRTPPSAVPSISVDLNGRSAIGQEIPWTNPTLDVAWEPASDNVSVGGYSILLERVDIPAGITTHMVGNQVRHVMSTQDLLPGGRYKLVIMPYDKAGHWGPAISTGEFAISQPLTYLVDPSRELVITALPVVEDQARTQGCGAWTLCGVMTSLSGGGDVNAFSHRFFQQLVSGGSVEGSAIVGSYGFDSRIMSQWGRDARGNIDIRRAPFHLLAIAHRPDLASAYDAGEGRLIFGSTNSQNNLFTIIFEYKMSTAKLSRSQWLAEWHRLVQFAPSDPRYGAQLQHLTDSFSTPGPNGVTLGQVRTNDGTLLHPWFMREFIQLGPGGDLMATTVKRVPHNNWFTKPEFVTWINDNEAAVLAETHEYPKWMNLAPATGIAGFPLDIPSTVRNKQAWISASRQTCGGCHAENTEPSGPMPPGVVPGFMVSPRKPGLEAQLNPFFSNDQLCGQVDGNWNCLFPFRQNEMEKRRLTLEHLLRAVGFTAAKSNRSVLREPKAGELVKYSNPHTVH